MKRVGGCLRAGVAAAVAIGVLAVPASSQAITPTIVNGGSRMFEQTVTSRESGDSSNRLEINAVVEHDLGKKVSGFKIDTDYNGTDNSSTATTQTATVTRQPTVVGGFNFTTAFISIRNTVSNIGCGDRPGFSHTVYVRPVLSDGTVGASSSASIYFTPGGGCNTFPNAVEDYPYVYGQSPVNPQQINPGASVTYAFTLNDPDTGNNTTGYAYRFRRLSDNITVAGASVFCDSGGIDDEAQSRSFAFPTRRGHWVLEIEPRQGSTCTSRAYPSGEGGWWRVGSADVNTPQASSPALSLSATRPQTGGSTTVTATTDDADDASDGGGVQYIEWDRDGNNTYDDATLGSTTGTGAAAGSDLLTTAQKSTTISTVGKTPGTYTVRARVTDNGAINASDDDRRQTVATTTYVVNSPPTGSNQTVSTTTGQAQAITLAGSDANAGDVLTFNITGGPSNGNLSGTGANRTYTPNAGYAGTDSFTYTVSDNYNGTSTTYTVTINVRPETTIDSGPANGSTAGLPVSFEFSSNATGAAFECQIDSDPYGSCSSPQAYNNLSDGSHIFNVRAVAGGQTDQSPATRTFTVDATAPETTIDSGPANGSTTNDDSVTFEFSSSEPNSTFECSVDSATFTSCTSPATYSDLGPGAHTFEVRATDAVGNTDPTPASRSFTLTDSGIATGDGTTTTFTAEPGDANAVTVTGGGGLPYVITDTGGGSIDAGPTCTQVAPNIVSCPDTANVVVNLGDGNDTFDGSTAAGGAFTINGGPGNDNLTGSSGNDTINGGADGGSDRMTGGLGDDTIDGGGGIDRALYSNSAGALDITIGDGANDSDGNGGTDNILDTVESITGGLGDDMITGSCGPNTLAGQGGNDTLNGDPASCGVYGGDFLGGGFGNDEFNGGSGPNDSVTYTTNSAAQGISVTLNNTADDTDGSGGTDDIGDDIETVYGGAGNDTINATAAGQGVSLWGRAGDDTLIGSPFNDYLRGEQGADNLDCAGSDNDMYDNDPADTVANCETPG